MTEKHHFFGIAAWRHGQKSVNYMGGGELNDVEQHVYTIEKN